MSLKIKAIKGFSFYSFFKIMAFITILVKIYLIARFLNPTDLGLYSITTIALGLTEALTQTGVNYTILQSKKPTTYFLDTAWVISIIRGLLISIIMLILGVILRFSFDNIHVLFLIGLSSLIPIIKGFINPFIIDLQVKMKFFWQAFYQYSLIFFNAFFVIIGSLMLKSAYGLVIGGILAALVEVLITFAFFKKRPHFAYNNNVAQKIFTNTKWLNIASFLSYLNDNLDDLIIGQKFSTFNLGIYHNAYSLSHKLNYELSESVYKSNLTIFSKMKKNTSRLTRAFLKSTFASFLILTLVSLPVFIFPKQIVLFILGQDWLKTIPLIRPLIIAGLIHSLTAMSYAFLFNTKNYQYVNYHLGLNLTLMVFLLLLLSRSNNLNLTVWAIFLSRLISLTVILVGVIKSLTFDDTYGRTKPKKNATEK